MVNNRIAECYSERADGRDNLSRDAVRYLVLHRISLANHDAAANPAPLVDAELDGPGLAHRFRNKGLGTGGKVPYHFLVRTDGAVDQLLPLSVRGSHAIGANSSSWAIAVVGEHRVANVDQIESVIRLCAALVPLAPYGARIIGHDEIRGGSADARKVCPRPVVDPREIAGHVDRIIATRPREIAGDMGIKL